MKPAQYAGLAIIGCLTGMPVAAMDVQHSSLVDVEAAFAHKTGTWQKQEVVWRPEWVTRFDSGARFTLIGEGRIDAQDELDPGRPDQPFRARNTQKGFPSDHIDLELREFFLDHYAGDIFVRVGKQQIVWGQADGLRVLDVINPLSYREFILPDIEHRRIPLWSALAEIPVDSWTAQLVWVPDATVTESPLPGATYSLIPDPFDEGRLQVNRPDSMADSDFGLKLSSFQNGWDLSLNYLYHTIDDPLIRIDTPKQAVVADYNRSHLIGGTASKPFGDVTVRSEVGVESKTRFQDSVTGQTTDTGIGSYVIGLDYSGLSDWFISSQFFQTYRFTGTGDDGSSKEQITLLIRHESMNNSLMLEALSIYDLNNEDSLIQLEAEYTASTNVVLRLAADLFFGDRSGTFGRFREESRLVTGFTLSF